MALDEEQDFEAHKRPKLNFEGMLDDNLSSTSSTSNRSKKEASQISKAKQKFQLKTKQGLKLVFIAYNLKANWQDFNKEDRRDGRLGDGEALAKYTKAGISLTSLAILLSQHSML